MAADGLFDFEGEQLTVLELAKRVLPGGVPAVPVVARPVADQAPTPRRVGRPRKNSASIQVAKQKNGGRLLRLWDQAIRPRPGPLYLQEIQTINQQTLSILPQLRLRSSRLKN
jgi:hypothetical protein